MNEIQFQFYLEQFLLQRTAPSNETVFLQVGETSLLDNLSFLGALFDFIAQKDRLIPSFTAFKELRDRPCRAPVTDDPILLKRAKKIMRKVPYFVGKKSISDTQRMKLAMTSVFHKERQKYLQLRGELDSLKTFSADREGYAKWVCEQLPCGVQTFLSLPNSFPLAESFRQRHTYVSGSTGSGKSEALKTLLHHYLKKDNHCALVVIDPHGDFSRQVAQFKENKDNDRLVFLCSDLKQGYTPILNPFDIQSGDDVEIRKEEILNAIIAVLGEDAQMTKQMKAVLSPCITTLLHLPNTNLDHLKQFMDDRQNESLIEASLKVLSNPSDIDFMQFDFDSTSYAPTKQSIRTRLHILLTGNSLRNFLVGKTTVDLREAIEQKKLIIFNLPNTGGDDSAALAMGRIILAQLLSIAMERGKGQKLVEGRTPIHLFIDEAHNFAVPSVMKILEEARKYKLYLTLANQFIGQFPNTISCMLRPEVEKNTFVKMTGFQSKARDAQAMANLVETTPELLASLPIGAFHIKLGELTGFCAQNGTALLGMKNAMTREEWDTVVESQVVQYYQKIPSREEAIENYHYTPPVPPKAKPKRKLN